MNIRQEVEKTLLAFASSQSPPISVAIEGKAFTKPKQGNYLEVVFEAPAVMNPTVDVTRVRKYGVIQILCFIETNRGVGPLEILTDSVAQLFPVYEKQRYQNFTVEQTPFVSQAFPEDRFLCAVVRVKYRQEL